MRELAGNYAKTSGLTWEQFTGFLASTAHTRRVMTLDEVANMAVFMASGKASGITGTTVNLSMGAVAD
jgi:enoyl-[acyl-carrier-protein] reductase (NADH)